jgi:hypothetical protein
MSETEYPKEITKDNIEQLRETAFKIKKKGFRLMITKTILYGIIGLITMPFIFFYLGVFLLHVLPEMSSQTFFGIFLIVFVIVFEIYLYLLLNLIELILEKAFKFPSHAERVFAQCFLMAYYLANNKRMKAIKEVDEFIMHLSVFTKDMFNPKRKEYAHEFNMLISGKNQIRRMLLFSEEKIADLLTSFGLALVHNEDSKAFSVLNKIINEARKYGKLEGRIQRFLSSLEKYPHLLTFFISIIAFLLAILGILPYKG